MLPKGAPALALIFLLSACTAGNHNIDFASMSTSDFNGTWTGVVECVTDGKRFDRGIEVSVISGQSRLYNFGDTQTDVYGKIDGRGVVRWEGEYTVDGWTGQAIPWSAIGEWNREEFHFWSWREPRLCAGTLALDLNRVPGHKARALRYRSYDPGDYAALFSGNWQTKAHTNKARLYYGEKSGKRPLVVLIPGLEGPNGAAHFFQTMPRSIAQAGGATLYVLHKPSIGVPGRVIDTFMAIRKAVLDPRIDPERVYLVGVGGGGLQALHMAMKPIHEELNQRVFKVAGMVLAYPTCRTQFESADIVPIPTLMLTGALDTVAPPEHCDSFIREVHGEAFIKRIEFQNAGHDWLYGKAWKTETRNSPISCGREFVDRDGYWSTAENKISSQSQDYYRYTEKVRARCEKPVLTTFGRVESAYDTTVRYVLAMIKQREVNCVVDSLIGEANKQGRRNSENLRVTREMTAAGLEELLQNDSADSYDSPDILVQDIYRAMRKTELTPDCIF